MNTHAQKTDQIQAKIEPIQQKTEDHAESIYADNRPGLAQLQAMQGIIANSEQHRHAIQMHSMMNSGSEQHANPIQMQVNQTGLPDQLKSGIENLSGYSMNDVKVHYNSSKPAQLNAHAYAQGTQIHVAPGQEKHVPHEAWHVVQQKQGRVQATKQLKGEIAINDDKGLEHEADVMGAKAMQLKSVEATNFASGQIPFKPVIQGAFTRSMRNMIEEASDLDELILLLKNSKYNSETKNKIGNEFLRIKGNFGPSDQSMVNDNYLSDEELGEEEMVDYVLNSSAHGGDVYNSDIDYNSKSYLDVAYPTLKSESETELEEVTMTDVSKTQFKTIQLARKGNVIDGPKNIITATSSIPNFVNSFYIRDGDGNIDFTVAPTTTRYKNYTGKKKPLKSPGTITWGNPQDSSTLVDLDDHPKVKNKSVKIDTKDRTQHFGMADYLLAQSKGWKNASASAKYRKSEWTWHHLSTPYEMVLVDMQAHAKHSHNGGVHIW